MVEESDAARLSFHLASTRAYARMRSAVRRESPPRVKAGSILKPFYRPTIGKPEANKRQPPTDIYDRDLRWMTVAVARDFPLGPIYSARASRSSGAFVRRALAEARIRHCFPGYGIVLRPFDFSESGEVLASDAVARRAALSSPRSEGRLPSCGLREAGLATSSSRNRSSGIRHRFGHRRAISNGPLPAYASKPRVGG
jgi:hypothetical protein